MRCSYCKEIVAGQRDIVIVKGEGPAHRLCFERDQFSASKFFGLDLQHLATEQLSELLELVKIELNGRTTDLEEMVEFF